MESFAPTNSTVLSSVGVDDTDTTWKYKTIKQEPESESPPLDEPLQNDCREEVKEIIRPQTRVRQTTWVPLSSTNDDDVKWVLERQIEVANALTTVQWPVGSNFLVLNNTSRHINGVAPLKDMFYANLTNRCGWRRGEAVQDNRVDLICELDGKMFVVEWETGNVASSFRSMFKIMALKQLHGDKLLGAAIILFAKESAAWLTDRIGTREELEGFCCGTIPKILSQSLGRETSFDCFTICHDALSDTVPIIPKQKHVQNSIRTSSASDIAPSTPPTLTQTVFESIKTEIDETQQYHETGEFCDFLPDYGIQGAPSTPVAVLTKPKRRKLG